MNAPLSPPQWPQKTRELYNHHMDSTIWNDFAFRDDDIVVATWAKSGTTWTQQIVTQLVFQGADDIAVRGVSPWLDIRVVPKQESFAMLEAQTHRRIIKTHLPLDALVYSPRAKYIYIGRDGRDVVWSMYNHHVNGSDLWYDIINNTPGRVGPPLERPIESIRDYFNEWLDRDGYPFWSFWDSVRSWWSIRHLPNFLLVHFADLKADMPGEIRRIADFLDITIDEAHWPAILEHCSFDYMKNNGDKMVPPEFWNGGGRTFINKGTNGNWRETLTAGDIRRYEETARRELGAECANWLANGRRGDRDR
jgi:aryl sulfotransferase